MPWLRRSKAAWIKVLLPVAVVGLVAFAAYLGLLYGQLKSAFDHQDQFIPTRIYSDVARISPPQKKTAIEERLASLGYSIAGAGAGSSAAASSAAASSAQADSGQIGFTLHAIDYPRYLIPDGHPQVDSATRSVTLKFDSEGPEGLLQSVELDGREVPDVYLEPELVATLSRGGANNKIRQNTKFDDIPAQVWQAIIAVEDRHFLEHGGFDPRGLARALWINLRTRSFAQGGSTITQQLVKMLMARHNKNPFRKINELFLSVLLETSFDKERILERYLNEVPLGQVGSLEVRGVAEGAEYFFGKKLDELNLGECALMAGLIRSTVVYSPYHHWERARERQKVVLAKMVENGQIAQAEADAAVRLPIRLAPPQTRMNKAPYFTDFVKAEMVRQLKDKLSEEEVADAGFRVYTTLDMAMNAAGQTAVAGGIAQLEKTMKLESERLEGALASVDQSTGYIRALIGGRSYAHSTFNRILNMKRQVGSTFKPIVYLSAFMKGEDAAGIAYGPGYPALDAPWTLVYDHGRQSWTPRNYEKESLGWIPLRRALAHSINTVAARLGHDVGTPAIVATARALGLESELPEVPSLALGVAELSPIELLRAYETLANHGMQEELTVIRAITQDTETGFWRFVSDRSKQVLEAGPTDLLTDMLQSVFTEGTAISALGMGFDRPAAGKTGTTSNYRDAWFAGYTPQLTTVVWVGQDRETLNRDTAAERSKPAAKSKAKDSPKLRLTGGQSALPIWVSYMKEALASDPPAAFPLSPALVDVQIDQHSGKLASPDCPLEQISTEKYVRGHEPRVPGCEPSWPPETPETVDP